MPNLQKFTSNSNGLRTYKKLLGVFKWSETARAKRLRRLVRIMLTEPRFLISCTKKEPLGSYLLNGARDEARTRDPFLGKEVFYHWTTLAFGNINYTWQILFFNYFIFDFTNFISSALFTMFSDNFFLRISSNIFPICLPSQIPMPFNSSPLSSTLICESFSM